MTPLPRALKVALALTPFLAACATPEYHYSQIFGERYFRSPIDTYPVLILRVDDLDNVFRPARVDPGLRKIRVQGPPGALRDIGEVREITLQIAPCTRYYLVAQKDNRLDIDFAVRVDFQEPVVGCTPPPRPS